MSILQGELVKIKADLTDDSDNSLTEKEVNFYVNDDKIGSDTTDENGRAKFMWDTASHEPGVYLIKAEYDGDGNIEGSEDLGEITIEKVENADFDNKIVETLENKGEVVKNTKNVINKINSDKVQSIEKCEDITYEEKEKVFETCTGETTDEICDEDGLNCYDEVSSYEYQCLKETKIVEKTKNECKVSSYVINDAVKLNTEGYECSVNDFNGEVVVICDSKYDGNGDGICTSGESCQKFIIDNEDKHEKFENNSKPDFVKSDETFFLQKSSVEVLE